MPEFTPTLLWAIALLPLAGFVANGVVAFVAPGRKILPTLIGPGVLAAAFAVAVVNFLGMRGAELHEPIVQQYWSWMPVGNLQVGAAFQLDQLSMLMTLIVTGVGFLIHVFSAGYM
ncbi:MAG: NADH-quinone oxidoreductase subunit L, partial [Longimicrobiales bacterium]